MGRWNPELIESFVESGADWRGKQVVIEYKDDVPLEEFVAGITPEDMQTGVAHVPGTDTYIITEHAASHIDKYSGGA